MDFGLWICGLGSGLYMISDTNFRLLPPAADTPWIGRHQRKGRDRRCQQCTMSGRFSGPASGPEGRGGAGGPTRVEGKSLSDGLLARWIFGYTRVATDVFGQRQRLLHVGMPLLRAASFLSEQHGEVLHCVKRLAVRLLHRAPEASAGERRGGG